MAMDTFEIDVLDSLKKTVDVINSLQSNFNNLDEFCNLEKYSDSAFSNNVTISKQITECCNTEACANPIVQHIDIDRKADGTQEISVVNYVYKNYDGPITLETANDVEVIFLDNDDDEPETEDREECSCDDDEED